MDCITKYKEFNNVTFRIDVFRIIVLRSNLSRLDIPIYKRFVLNGI